MSKIIFFNRTPLKRDALLISTVVVSLIVILVVGQLSRMEPIGGWVALHQKMPAIVLLELLPVLFPAFLFFITSKTHQLQQWQQMKEAETRRTERIASILENIKTGEFDGDKDTIGVDLLDSTFRDIHKQLKQDAEEDRQRSWSNEGLARFRAVMGAHQTIQAMCDELMPLLVKYLGANQAGIFLANQEVQLELVSCYAFDRKKFLKKAVEPGEGLVGQCYLERETIFMTKVPENYMNITSGLGQGNPRSLLIVPLNLKETTVGVLELASFSIFDEHVLAFIDKLAEALAQSISSIRTAEETQKLLNMSLQREHELKDQEERTRQSIEELYVVQEDMRKVNLEMEEIFRAINTLTATVELDTHGRIIKLNDHFSETLGFSLQQLHGKHFTSLLAEENGAAGEFDSIWEEITAGKAREHVFCLHNNRLTRKWIRTGLYPMKTASENVSKVLCFLTDVSVIKQKELELDQVNKQMEATRSMLIKILNEIPLKVFLKRYDGRFFIVNDAVSRFHGFDAPEGLIGKSDFDFYDAKDATDWLEAEHKIIASGKTEYLHEDGGRVLSTVKMPFHIDPLGETGLLGYQADVTELERAKEKIAQLKD